ncbi:hypothetical protein BIU82_07535 [Arthrobacter sp. SW1]|uniref:CHRD domain-containing protein n=1 Tax=Arthrobacter sp. SW1 TaxID=1920889 RepID=UPI000877B12C|nr:CHRD domain-containing protein [Arthrobacter sp. SW1]OFI37713.1 hypothetical protein BIU82_07535 [Arthrobacter sp. SW1]
MPATFKAIAALGAATALALAGAGPAAAKSSGTPTIPLNPGQVTAKARTGASGFFSYRISGGAQFCYTLTVRNLTGPDVGAEIGFAPRNADGPRSFGLITSTGTDWTIDTCMTLPPVDLEAIAADPGSYYVNVYSTTFPGGEIRGQLK